MTRYKKLIIIGLVVFEVVFSGWWVFRELKLLGDIDHCFSTGGCWEHKAGRCRQANEEEEKGPSCKGF